MQQDINAIIEAVLSRLEAEHQPHAPSSSEDIPAEISARHVHLSREDLLELTGASDLVNSRSISQPGQFLSSLRVRLIGPKGMIDNVAVLGPLRRQTQAEISATDARELGLQAPVRLSGDLKDAAQIHIQAGERIICRKAAIIAKRHLHAAPGDAQRLGIADGQELSIRLAGIRPLILEGVVVRVSQTSALALHIDTDEANAAGIGKDAVCRIAGINIAAQSQDQPSRAPQDSGAYSCPDRLITEQHVKGFKREGVRAFKRLPGQLITPLARDTLKAFGITLEE